MPEHKEDNRFGKGGKLVITGYKNTFPIRAVLEDAWTEMGYGKYDESTPIGSLDCPQTIEEGTRCNSARAFLAKSKGRNNLFVATGAHVTRVLIDPSTKTAYGVEVGNLFVCISTKLQNMSFRLELVKVY